MKNARFYAISAAATLALAGRLFAGGFWLQLEDPEANPEARKANAVLTIKATGCQDPATARVVATAIGMVNGRRESIDLKLMPLSEPGTFALARQWPSEGHWVIRLVGRNGERFTNALVAAGPEGVDRVNAKRDMKEFPAAAVEALLR